MQRIIDILTMLAGAVGLLLFFGGALAVISMAGCGPNTLDCPDGYHANAAGDACVADQTTGDDPAIPNVLVEVVYQDGAPVDLDQLLSMNPDPEIPPFQVIGKTIRDVLDPESGLTSPTAVRDALTIVGDATMPKNVRLIIDGGQWVQGHICTPCSGCVNDTRELKDWRDGDGNMIPNEIMLINHPDGFCYLGHAPDCQMQPDPSCLWGPYLDVLQCCQFAGTGDQDVCNCPSNRVVCDEGTICTCEAIQ